MDINNLNEKIKELFNETPDDVGVVFGPKVKNNQLTEELCFVFTVPHKKPLEDLTDDELLPEKIFYEGKEYKTDVVQRNKIVPFYMHPQCSGDTRNFCYTGWYPNTINSNYVQTHRPVSGGTCITSDNSYPAIGTFGGIVVDNKTNTLVGLTNNHVVVKNAFYTIYRDPNGIYENEVNDNVYQTGFNDPSLKIGKVLRYVPIHIYNPPASTISNQIDGAIFSLNSSVVSESSSFKQRGMNIFTQPLPFATTAEIDDILTKPGTILYSSGARTGVKDSPPCDIRLYGVAEETVSGYFNQNVELNARFNNIISFVRTNIFCPYPIAPGDSGSLLLGNINGTIKIVGLNFAGTTEGFEIIYTYNATTYLNNPNTTNMTLVYDGISYNVTLGTGCPCSDTQIKTAIDNVLTPTYVNPSAKPGVSVSGGVITIRPYSDKIVGSITFITNGSTFTVNPNQPQQYQTNISFGYACRIDKVAEQLDISAWTGGTVNYVNESTIDHITVPGINTQKTIICDGKTYWQIGMTNISKPC